MAMLPAICAQLRQRRFHLGASSAAERPSFHRIAGTQHLVVGIEQRCAVHVAGQSNAAHALQFIRMQFCQPVDGGEGRAPPVGRVLFGPAGLGPSRFVAGCGGFAQRLAALADQQRLDPGGADIDAEERRTARYHEVRTSLCARQTCIELPS
jgi:4'-phosphopantetheinyl transferase EntD